MEKKKKILVINGPSINLIGYREVEIYGHETYLDLIKYIKSIANEYRLKINTIQTNSEGEIIDYLQTALLKKYDGIVLNAGAYTHYSYSIKDAIRAICIETVEVHLSDISSREDFRKTSVIRDECVALFMGKHFESYKEAILYFVTK